MERVTERQLEQLAKMIQEEMRWAGLITSTTERVIVDMGSKTYGRAYRIYTTDIEKGGGLSDAPLHLGDGYLGQTKREAWLCLRSILRTFEAMRHSKKENK